MQASAAGRVSTTAAGKADPPPPRPSGRAVPLHTTSPCGPLPHRSPGAEGLPTLLLTGARR